MEKVEKECTLQGARRKKSIGFVESIESVKLKGIFRRQPMDVFRSRPESGKDKS
jgi:hypothetical protein